MKKVLIALASVIAVALFVGVAGFFIFKSTKPLSTVVIDTSGLPQSGYIEHAKYYDITTNYATSTPLLALGVPSDATAIASMKKFVSDTISQFKSDGNFANLTPTDVATLGFSSDHKESLEIRYLIASSPHTVSYLFTVYENTFGAHPNTYFRTFTFDTTAGAELSLADLFISNASYLEKLSEISRRSLPDVIGGEVDAAFKKNFIDPGTTPNAKNFANFFFDNQDFVILFAPYAVAPYSAGPQTLRIPVSELASLLKPEYR